MTNMQPTMTYQTSGILEAIGKPQQLDPYLLRRIFLLLTRNHFTNPKYFGENLPPSFKNFRYSDNEQDRTVIIDLDYVFSPKSTEQPTAIYVGVGDVRSQKKVIADFNQSEVDLSGQKRTVVDQVSVDITHVSKSPDEALILGVITKSFYQGVGPLLQNRLGLLGYDVVLLSKPRMFTPESADPAFRVDLEIQLVCASNWVTTQESLRVKSVDFDLVF